MSRKRFSAEEIVNKLRAADVALAKGAMVAQASSNWGSRTRRTIGGIASSGA